ncbi:MAG: PQQ-dependent sugar dehydrogenase [Myxococcales bacterium]|nr:PQQ-dependent sugar dehydrogenase [Myxococcales bacterium]
MESTVHRVAVLAVLTVLACRRDPSPSASPPPVTPAAPRPADPAVDPAAEPPTSEALSAPPAAVAGAVALVPFASGFERPVALVAAPGDPRQRLFVVEQPGFIRVIEGGRRTDVVVLDISALVSSGNEQGLLDVAFHPRFAENQQLYVDYTDRDGDTHVVGYTLAPGGDAVDPASARELLRIEQPYSNHNGGHLVFGPDGALWIGTGDGGAAGDPKRNGQNPTALLGKMLRLDVDAPAPKPEIVAIGLRNPWRYAFDAATGDLYIGDVGQNEWESVYVVPADHRTGHNFGWNVAEGRHCYDAETCDRTPFTAPVTDYPHTQGCSITGGVVYRGPALPVLAGVYFYADYCTALVRSFRWSAAGIRDHWDWKAALDPDGVLSQISTFGVDHAGEVYVVSLGGDIWRLAPR